MNIPVILYGDDGTLLHGIESQRGAVSVARTTDDLAEALGFAQTGIARVLLCAVPVTDLTASMVATLAEAEVRVVIIADPRDKLPFGTYWVDSNAELADVLNTLEQASLGTILAVGEQPRPQLAASPDGYGYDAAYGYSIPQTQQAPVEAPEAPQPHNYPVEPIEEPTTVIGNTEPESAPQNPQTYVTYRAYRYDPQAEKAAREVTEVIASDDSSELLANDADNSGAVAANTEEKHALTPQQQQAAELNPEEAVLNEAAAILNGFDPTQPKQTLPAKRRIPPSRKKQNLPSNSSNTLSLHTRRISTNKQVTLVNGRNRNSQVYHLPTSRRSIRISLNRGGTSLPQIPANLGRKPPRGLLHTRDRRPRIALGIRLPLMQPAMRCRLSLLPNGIRFLLSRYPPLGMKAKAISRPATARTVCITSRMRSSRGSPLPTPYSPAAGLFLLFGAQLGLLGVVHWP